MKKSLNIAKGLLLIAVIAVIPDSLALFIAKVWIPDESFTTSAHPKSKLK